MQVAVVKNNWSRGRGGERRKGDGQEEEGKEEGGEGAQRGVGGGEKLPLDTGRCQYIKNQSKNQQLCFQEEYSLRS